MKRTDKQRAAIEVYCNMVAEACNAKGLDMVEVLSKKAVEIPWTQYMVKELIFKKIELVMLGKVSTTQLEKTEVSTVYDVMNRWLINNFDISVPFPEDKNK
jgi:hypothetical protein